MNKILTVPQWLNTTKMANLREKVEIGHDMVVDYC